MAAALAQQPHRCSDFIITVTTQAVERELEHIGANQQARASRSKIIVLWGPAEYGKTQTLLHLKDTVRRRSTRNSLLFIQQPSDVVYCNPPGDFLPVCRRFMNQTPERWHLLLLDCNERDFSEEKTQMFHNLNTFWSENEFNTTIVLAVQSYPNGLRGHGNLSTVPAKTFNNDEVNELITKLSEQSTNRHMVGKLAKIYDVLKDRSPKFIKSKLEIIIDTAQNGDDVDYILEGIERSPEESEPNRRSFQPYKYQEIWMVVSFVGDRRFTRDFLMWIIMVYHGMYDDDLRGTHQVIAGEMIKYCKEGHFMKIEKIEREDCYTLINTSGDLVALREDSGQELKYFRVFLYALFHMIDKDLRFHLLKRDKPLEIITLQEIADNVLSNALCERLATVRDPPAGLNLSEVEVQFYGLNAAVEYFKLQSTEDRPSDLEERITYFKERCVRKSRLLYDGAEREERETTSATLRKAVQRVHRFTNRDVKTLKELHNKVKASARPHRPILLNKNEKEIWCRDKHLLSEDICSKLYIGEIHAWILTAYGKLLKKHRRQSSDGVWEHHLQTGGEQPQQVFEEAHNVYDYLKTTFLPVNADLLQRVILVRDELLLEEAQDDVVEARHYAEAPQDEEESRRRNEEALDRFDIWKHKYETKLDDLTKFAAAEPPKGTQKILAYEYGVVRSNLRTDKYHELCRHQKMIQIDRLFLDKIAGTDTRRANVVDAIITHSSNEFSHIRKLIYKFQESGENWILENCCRMYAYCLEEAALLLQAACYHEKALIFFACALEMLHVYFGRSNEELADKVLRERKYIDMCQTIRNYQTALVPDNVRLPDLLDLPSGNVFTQCICWPISEEDVDDCPLCSADHITRGMQLYERCAFRLIYDSLTGPVPAPEAAGRDAQPTHEDSKQIATDAIRYIQDTVSPAPQN